MFRVCTHNDDQQDLVVQGLKSLGISFDQQEVRRCAPRSLNLEADNLEDSLWYISLISSISPFLFSPSVFELRVQVACLPTLSISVRFLHLHRLGRGSLFI